MTKLDYLLHELNLMLKDTAKQKVQAWFAYNTFPTDGIGSFVSSLHKDFEGYTGIFMSQESFMDILSNYDFNIQQDSCNKLRVVGLKVWYDNCKSIDGIA